MKLRKRNKGVQAPHIKFRHHAAQAVSDRDLRIATSCQLPETKDSTLITDNCPLPDWWPCLCNGGWDLCPVCQCGMKNEPPCIYCGPGSEPPIARPALPGDQQLDGYAMAAASADEASWKGVTYEDLEAGFAAYWYRDNPIPEGAVPADFDELDETITIEDISAALEQLSVASCQNAWDANKALKRNRERPCISEAPVEIRIAAAQGWDWEGDNSAA